MIENNKINRNTICAIDASTNNIAFAIFNNKELGHIGKLKFSGNNIYQKIGDSYAKTRALFDLYKIDSVVIEHTIFMNSPKTVSDLALIQDSEFLKWVEAYANDQNIFFENYSLSYKKISELGYNSIQYEL